MAAHQALPSMGFSRQEYWSGVPVPSPKSAYCNNTEFISAKSLPIALLNVPVTQEHGSRVLPCSYKMSPLSIGLSFHGHQGLQQWHSPGTGFTVLTCWQGGWKTIRLKHGSVSLLPPVNACFTSNCSAQFRILFWIVVYLLLQINRKSLLAFEYSNITLGEELLNSRVTVTSWCPTSSGSCSPQESWEIYPFERTLVTKYQN